MHDGVSALCHSWSTKQSIVAINSKSLVQSDSTYEANQNSENIILANQQSESNTSPILFSGVQ